MAIKLTILGSGTALPMARRASPAHLIETEDAALLLDCGSGATTGLARAGVGVDRLAGVALTHLHPDHVADLVPLLFALHLPRAPRRVEDLRLWGPAGVASHLAALRGVYGRWIQPREVAVQVRELVDQETLAVGALRITAHRVTHAESSLAYRIQSGGAVLCYSGDSGPCAALEEAARDVDLLLCECAALEEERSEDHLSASDVGRLAAASSCREVILTHLYDHVVASDPLARVRALYSGPVRLAEDGMVVELGDVTASRAPAP
jgi:ribonuclease Z